MKINIGTLFIMNMNNNDKITTSTIYLVSNTGMEEWKKTVDFSFLSITKGEIRPEAVETEA